MNQYYIIYERDEECGYVASAPGYPGLCCVWKTLQEAYKNICLAIKRMFGGYSRI